MKQRYVIKSLLPIIVSRWLEGDFEAIKEDLEDLRCITLYAKDIIHIKILKRILEYIGIHKSWYHFFIYQFKIGRLIWIGKKWNVNKTLIIEELIKDIDLMPDERRYLNVYRLNNVKNQYSKVEKAIKKRLFLY